MKYIDATITIFATMENIFSNYNLWIEIIGTVTGILGVWLTIKQNIWCFPVGIVSVLLYSWLAFINDIHANALLQIVYMFVLIYGWYNWNKVGTNLNELPVTESSRKLLLSLSFVFVLTFIIVYSILINLGHLAMILSLLLSLRIIGSSDVPIPDSFTLSLGIIAQYLIARKKIENWHLWIIVNIVSAGLYAYKGLFLMAGFYLLLIMMAVIGYIEWKKDLQKQAG